MKIISTLLALTFCSQITLATVPSPVDDITQVAFQAFSRDAKIARKAKREDRRERHFFKKFNRQFDRFTEAFTEDILDYSESDLRKDLADSLAFMNNDSTLSELAADFKRMVEDTTIDIKAEALKLVSKENKQKIILKMKKEIAEAGGFDKFIDKTNRDFKLRWCHLAKVGSGIGAVVFLVAAVAIVPQAFMAVYVAMTIQNIGILAASILSVPATLFLTGNLFQRCQNRN